MFRMKNKKVACLWLLILFFSLSGPGLFAGEELAALISGKKWLSLPALFADESGKILPEYFAESLSIKFVTYAGDRKLTYKTKFSDYAEIGTITYDVKDGKYVNLRIENEIKPLYFIEKFRQYAVRDLTIRLGEAEIYFQDGDLYQVLPFGQVFLFKGTWRFSLRPSDEEERLTLEYQFKKDTLTKTSDWGVFILPDMDFIKSLAPGPLVENVGAEIIQPLDIYIKYFGIKIKQFDEHWYLPFKAEDNLVLFSKDQDVLYFYSFNESANPDTMLFTSENNDIVLSYNAGKSVKLSFAEADRMTKINLNLFFNPVTNFISGTTYLYFENPSPLKVLNLNTGLKIRANLDEESRGLSVVRKGGFYYFLGPAVYTSSLFYSGYLGPTDECADVFKKQVIDPKRTVSDRFFFLSRTQDFYPNSFIDFSEVKATVSVPGNLNCLASGKFLGDTRGERNSFTFSSPGVKGFSLVCGDFDLRKTIKSPVPIRVYSADLTKKGGFPGGDKNRLPRGASVYDYLARFFDFKKLKDAWEFLLDKFGGLDLDEINLLFQRSPGEGGVSEKGFILFRFNPDSEYAKMIRLNSPIVLDIEPTSNLIHELAHQWWGGQISWKTYRDVWITEGLAQFSMLFYLEHRFSERKFSQVLERMKRWVYKHNQHGPLIYGTRLSSINQDYEAYQGIVYNKGAFIFLMLKDMMGEEKFLSSLQQTVEKLKYRSVTSATFIKTFCQGDEVLNRFFNGWVFSRKIPEISIRSHLDGHTLDIYIDQADDRPFVFPVTIDISTEKGHSRRVFTVTQKNEHIHLEETSPIKQAILHENRSLVRLKKE